MGRHVLVVSYSWVIVEMVCLCFNLGGLFVNEILEKEVAVVKESLEFEGSELRPDEWSIMIAESEFSEGLPNSESIHLIFSQLSSLCNSSSCEILMGSAHGARESAFLNCLYTCIYVSNIRRGMWSILFRTKEVLMNLELLKITFDLWIFLCCLRLLAVVNLLGH
jgi:hypothetical protein